MRKLIIALLMLFISTNVFAWTSETGSGVVSDSENIIRASLEATQVLQSDTASYLYGVTRFGGTVNYSSIDSGGVLRMDNVVSSRDTMHMKNDQFISWVKSTGDEVRVGVSADDSFTLPSVLIDDVSIENAHIETSLSSSGEANFVKASVDTLMTGNAKVSDLTTTLGDFQKSYFGVSHGVLIDSASKIIYQTNRPKRTIVLTGGGATTVSAAQSVDTMGIGGSSPIFKNTTLKFSPFSEQEAQWSFIVPNSYVGTSVDANIVWYEKDQDTGSISFDVSIAGISDMTSFDNVTFGVPGTVTDSFVASGEVMITGQFSVPSSLTSGQVAVVRLIRRSSNVADTTSHDVNVLGVRVAYEAQTESD